MPQSLCIIHELNGYAITSRITNQFFNRALEADHRSLLKVANWMFPDLSEWTAAISPCRAFLGSGRP